MSRRTEGPGGKVKPKRDWSTNKLSSHFNIGWYENVLLTNPRVKMLQPSTQLEDNMPIGL